jgi:type II secretory pathway component PulM
VTAGAASPLRAPAPLARWWSAKSRGERVVAAGIALVAAAALAWWGLWQPLARDVVATRTANARGAAALAEARRMGEEIALLGRTAPPPAAADPRAELERVVAQYGLRAAVAQQDWKDGRATLVFPAVGFDGLVALLEALQRDARLRVVAASLAARVEPGTVRAELTLTR